MPPRAPLYTFDMSRAAPRWAAFAILCAAAPVFLAGIRWGLPSRAADPYLFGDSEPWSGAKILSLAGGWEADPNRGADIARSPLADRQRAIVVNQTDSARAAILVRYRLYTYQPDEMITFRALSGMRPSKMQLDPRLYQYGGLWIYPVGALLQGASRAGWVALRPDVSWYLDHPEEFGQMYVVARAYSVFWGLVGVLVVFALVRQIAGGWVVPAAAGLCFAAMPVIVNGAHEAKPHLGGLALTLLAVLVAARYVQTGAAKWWILAGVFCGAATAMVPTAYPTFVVLLVMAWLRGRTSGGVLRKWKILLASVGVGVAVFFLCNPYLAINLFFNRNVLKSNLGNSAAMYHADASAFGLINAAFLMTLGTSPLLAIAGAVGLAGLASRAVSIRRDHGAAAVRRRAVGLLLAAPAVLVAIQFCLLASGKPGEYGRFAMLPDVLLMVEAIVAVGTFVKNSRMQAVLLTVILGSTLLAGGSYVRGFVRDAGESTSRLHLAERLHIENQRGMRSLAVATEPAPYCLPPVDLFRWEIRLVPRDLLPNRLSDVGDVSVRTVDSLGDGRWRWLFETPISWADKPFELTVQESPKPAAP